MNDRIAALGVPDLTLEGFRLWVHGYQFPELTDEWDGNWLRVTAYCGAMGASVWADGALLDTVSVLRFARDLSNVYKTLHGQAVLESHEPNLVVRATVEGRTGQVAVHVEVTPDHMTQQHTFEFTIDQSYLPATIAQSQTVLQRYPVRGASRRGV